MSTPVFVNPAEALALAATAKDRRNLLQTGEIAKLGTADLEAHLLQVQTELMHARQHYQGDGVICSLEDEARKLVAGLSSRVDKSSKKISWPGSNEASKELALRHELLMFQSATPDELAATVRSLKAKTSPVLEFARVLPLQSVSRSAVGDIGVEHLPSSLDQATVEDFQAILTQAIERNPSNPIQALTSRAHMLLAAMGPALSDVQVRELLEVGLSPANANWFDLVVRHLTTKDAKGKLPNFGSLRNAHQSLTRDQLDRLGKVRPELRASDSAYRARLIQLEAQTDDVGTWIKAYDPLATDAKSQLSQRIKLLDFVWKLAREDAATMNNWFNSVLQYQVLWYEYLLQPERLDVERFTDGLPALQRLNLSSSFQPTVKLASPAASGCKALLTSLFGEVRSVEEGELMEAYLTALCVVRGHLSPDVESVDAAVDAWVASDTGDFSPELLYTVLTKYVARHGSAEARRSHAAIKTPGVSMMWTMPGEGVGSTEQVAQRQAAQLLQSRQAFGSQEPVRLDILLSGIASLVVKVYRIHPANYYKTQKKELDVASLDLDSLVPKHEFSVTLDELSRSRSVVRHTLDLTDRLQADGCGTFVVEMYGGGYRTRCLFRKGGGVVAVSEPSAQGHMFCLVDEETQLPYSSGGGSIYFNGQTFHADASSGLVLIPWGTGEGASLLSDAVLIAPDGIAASLMTVNVGGEQYAFEAKFFVDREALLTKCQATVLVRTRLALAGTALSVEQLVRSARVTVSYTDVNGIVSQQIVDPLPLSDSSDATLTLQVPEYLASVKLELSADVKHACSGAKQGLYAIHTERVFVATDTSAPLVDLYLVPAADGAALDLVVLGRAGEPLPGQRVQLRLDHRWLREPMSPLVLMTDAAGRLQLGNLKHIVGLEAQLLPTVDGTDSHTVSRAWSLGMRGGTDVDQAPLTRGDQRSNAFALSGTQTLTLSTSAPREARLFRCAHLSTRMYVSDYSATHLDVQTHPRKVIVLGADLPAGVYHLFLAGRAQPCEIELLVEDVAKRTLIMDAYRISSKQREVQLVRPSTDERLMILSVSENDDADVVIQLTPETARNGSTTRVHVLATHFLPTNGSKTLNALNLGQLPLKRTQSYRLIDTYVQFSQQARVGGESEYDDQVMKDGPRVGNLLPRPSLLVQERVLGDTSFAQPPAMAAAGVFEKRNAMYAMRGQPESCMMMDGCGFTNSAGSRSPTGAPALEFLKQSSELLTNLRPDAQGRVIVPRAQLGAAHRFLTVWAVGKDAFEWTSTTACLSAKGEAAPYRSTALATALPSDKHFTEVERVQVLRAGEKYCVMHEATSALVTLNHLTDAGQVIMARLATSNASDAKEWSSKLAPLLRWNTFSQSKKCQLYGELACHEVNLFVHRKDPAFFREVVAPTLADKLTNGLATTANLMDAYLLSDKESLGVYASDPYKFGQLNTLERILLAEGLAACGDDVVAQQVLDAVVQSAASRIPTHAETHAVFQTALQTKAMQKETEAAVATAVSFHGGRGGGSSRGAKPAAAADVSRGNCVSMEDECFFEDNDDDDDCEEEDASEDDINCVGSCDSDSDECEKSKPKSKSKSFESARKEAMAINKTAVTLFQSPPTTKELIERTYWGCRSGPAVSNAQGLVPNNAFWADYARHISQQLQQQSVGVEFVSASFGHASSTLTEALCALAVLDLPFESAYQAFQYHDRRAAVGTMQAVTPVLVFHRLFEAQSTQVATGSAGTVAPLNISMHYLTTKRGKSASLILPSEHPCTLTRANVQGHYCDVCGANSIAVVYGCRKCNWDACEACFLRLRSAPVVADDSSDDSGFVAPDAFVTGRVYQARVILTNVSDRAHTFQVLHQIPSGAVPVADAADADKKGHLPLVTSQMTLPVFETRVITKAFYFPLPGDFAQYPTQATAEGGQVLAHATNAPARLRVTDQREAVRARLSALLARDVDGSRPRTWSIVSQLDDADALLHFLSNAPLAGDLDAMLWRFNGGVNRELFFRVLDVLRKRMVFDAKVWGMVLAFSPPPASDIAARVSYERALREFLGSQATIRSGVGPYLSSNLLHTDDVDSLEMQYREYTPLISARAHQVSTSTSHQQKHPFIQNVAFAKHYQAFLRYLRYRYPSYSEMTTDTRMQLTYYLLLQDRVAQAQATFGSLDSAPTRKNKKRVAEVRSPAYDYLRCYFAFFSDKPQAAQEIADRYKDYPLLKQRRMFTEVAEQLAEIPSSSGGAGAEERKKDGDDDTVADALARSRQQEQQAQGEASVDFELFGAHGLDILTSGGPRACQIRINIFPMLVRPAFSRAPFSFTHDQAAQATAVLAAMPLLSAALEVPRQTGRLHVDLSALFPQANLETTNAWIQVETCDGSALMIKARLAHQLRVDVKRNQGLVYVRHAQTGAPQSAVYVKVYAQNNDGTVTFYKDTYTDHRGVADFASLSTSDLDRVSKFALLITHEAYGSLVKQVEPPARA